MLGGHKVVAQFAAQVLQFVGVAARQDLLDPCAFAAAFGVELVVRGEHAFHSISVECAIFFRRIEVLPEAVRLIGIEI
eukprot:5378153-Pleurochrysis_carterae.AAC.1